MWKRRWRRFVVLLLVTCVGGALLTPTPGRAAKKKILNFAAKEPESLDPHSSTQGPVQAIARFLYRGLTRFAIKDGKVTTSEAEPDLAESWTVSADGTQWTFRLRKGVQFHKGFGEMTAEDVKFSFERQLQRTKGMLFAQNINVIKEMIVVDPYTITFTLHAYDPLFLLRMVGYQHGYIMSKKAIEQYGEGFGWHPVGTGPFYFDKHLPREKVILKAHEAYYSGRPQIDEVHWFDVPEDATKLIGFAKGTFDILYPEVVTADVETQVKKIGGVIDRRGPGSQERFYIDMTKAPFDDIRVRQALLHAVDRKAIKETLYPSALADLAVSPLSPGYFGHIPVEIPAYNPEKAKQLLATAGHPNGFTIKNFFISKAFFFPKLMTLLQEQLKQVGINVEVQLVEHPTYHEHIRKNLNPFVLYGGTRLTDGDVWLSLFFYSKEIPDPATGNKGTNFAHYTGIDDLLEQGRRERDQERRAQLYHEAQQRIMHAAICLPIVDVPFLQPRNPKRVQAPFDPEYGEFSLHFNYNYPEMLKILD